MKLSDLVREQPLAWLDGRWIDPGQRFDVVNPATMEIEASVADCGAGEAAKAIDVAERAFLSWRRTSIYERCELLHRFYHLLLDYREEIAEIIAREMGKPIREARSEVVYAAGFVSWYAEEGKRLYGETIPASNTRKRIAVELVPVGPVAAIIPWNFPAAMVTRKLAPALAAGCTIIVKPAEQAPLTTIALGRLLEEAGTPPGVVQIITTSQPAPVVDRLLSDERIRKLTFTGSVPIGRLLYEKAARTIKRVSLELGGHAPIIVFDDADLDHAVEEIIACKFRNSGQTCVSANRLYVQEGIYGALLERLKERFEKLRLGIPTDEQTEIGPLIDEAAFRKVLAHVDNAKSLGAQVLTGGERAGDVGRVCERGYFFKPTLLSGVQPNMLVCREETFGPVLPVASFKTEDEAIQKANDTPYGLAAYVFTRDLERTIRVVEALDFGIVGVNDGIPSTPQAPFGGVKFSGVGREGGRHGIEEYVERKFVSLKLSEPL